jgi:hypothetical protein
LYLYKGGCRGAVSRIKNIIIGNDGVGLLFVLKVNL